jgi:NAD(P)H-dependent nitrite reductase small subunit
MPEFTVAKVSELKENAGIEVEAGGYQLALFRYKNKFYAMDNICPHRGGPLGVSEVVDGIVSCPLHAWQFRVTDGQCTHMDGVKQACFPVRVEGDEIKVEIPN